MDTFYNLSTGTVISFSFMFITIFFSVYLMFIYFRADRNRKISEHRQKLLKQYIEILENNYDDIENFMSEYVALIRELENSFDKNQYSRLNELLKGKILPFRYDISKETVLLERLSHIKINELKSILYTKLVQCKSQNLNIVFDVPLDIDNINMESIDLVRVLGIFIDNAIESALMTEEKIIILGFYKGSENDHVINVKNSFDDTPDVNRIFDSGYSTKDVSGQSGRGLGLVEVKKIIHKYDNITLETKIDSSMHLFVQELYIF